MLVQEKEDKETKERKAGKKGKEKEEEQKVEEKEEEGIGWGRTKAGRASWWTPTADWSPSKFSPFPGWYWEKKQKQVTGCPVSQKTSSIWEERGILASFS